MNESWHIPRASLGSSVSSSSTTQSLNSQSPSKQSSPGNSQNGSIKKSIISSSNKSIFSNELMTIKQQGQQRKQSKALPMMNVHTIATNNNNNYDTPENGYKNYGFQNDNRMESDANPDHCIVNTQHPQQQRNQEKFVHKQKKRRIRDIDKMVAVNIVSTDTLNINEQLDSDIKRGSHSSQGSTDSNHSSHSASSGSLLLTAANLEKFAQIHKTQNQLQHNQLSSPSSIAFDYPQIKQYHQNLTTSIGKIPNHRQQQQQQQNFNSIEQQTTIKIPSLEETEQIKTINNLIQLSKTKDFDTISIASSTHFTVVNGMGGPQRTVKDGPCSRGHQITVLILTMSIIFLIGIVGAVFFLELRAQKMPH